MEKEAENMDKGVAEHRKMQSTVHITANLCGNIPFAVLIASTSISFSVSMQSDICMYTHILHTIEMLVRQKEIKKIWTSVNAAGHRFTSPGLNCGLND